MKRIFLLKGLDCPNCSAKIEKEVGELDGVQSSVVNLMKQTLTINVAPAVANTIASQIETIVHSHEPDVEVSEIAQEYYIPAKKQDTNTSYNNEDKKLTIRLAIGAAIYGIGMALTVFAKVPLPVELVFLIVSYIILGGDVVWQAVPHRQPPWHFERQGGAGGSQPALSGPRGLCRDQPDAQRALR